MNSFLKPVFRPCILKHIFLCGLSTISFAFPASGKGRADIGKLTPERTCFDVLHYRIAVKVMPREKSISGINTIRFRMTRKARLIRLDLDKNMEIRSIRFQYRELPFRRSGNTFFMSFDDMLKQDSVYEVTVAFAGKPLIAVWPPWKGGFVWSQSAGGADWIGLACENTGASLWLPCKDHWSDEADSMDMFLTVPNGLTGVSNGKLIGDMQSDSGYNTFHWQVRNPINNYNISVNAAYYTNILDTFKGAVSIPLSYYVLPYNADKAKTHFLQVHTMLSAFEHYFGPYPFPEDSYKLVETPYWGMEHQSCIAYGNNYLNNAYGFDFIIVHESGHEWFANNITASDPADMWIHESFTTYSEALYLEYTQNRTVAEEYLLDQKKKIVSKKPMQGPRGLYYHNVKDNDIYYKGTWMLQSMRSIINNDSVWFASLRNLNDSFRHAIVCTEDIIRFYNNNTNYQWDNFFRQYLYSAAIPDLYINTKDLGNGNTRYTFKLGNTVKGFAIPLQIHSKYGAATRMLKRGEKTELVLDKRFDLYAYLNAHYLFHVKVKD